MRKNELEFYNKVGNWDFSKINYEKEIITNWDYYEKIRENVDENSLCLDLGTGAGENVLKHYPTVGMLIATDFSAEMIKNAKENIKKYPRKNIKFILMDNLNITFPENTFDLISARHTIIDAYQIYKCLRKNGTLVIRGVDKNDCLELKKIFGRGQGQDDYISISDLDYANLKEAGFSNVEKVEIRVNEYYKTKEDLMALLLKTPILERISKNNEKEMLPIEQDLFDKYVKQFNTKRGILLKRLYYGIIAKK